MTKRFRKAKSLAMFVDKSLQFETGTTKESGRNGRSDR